MHDGLSVDISAMRADLREYVVGNLAEDDGVLVIGEPELVRAGTKPAREQGRGSGRAACLRNRQTEIFLLYATSRGMAFLDGELYLPREWVEDPEKREKMGVPLELRFVTKPQIAQQMLQRSLAQGVPVAWVTGNEVYGGDTLFRRWLEGEGRAYVLGVPDDHTVVWQDGLGSANALVADLPEDAWRTYSCRVARREPELHDWSLMSLGSETLRGMAHWLLSCRGARGPREIDSFLCFGPANTGFAELVRIAAGCWAIEAALERVSEAVGLGLHRVRGWKGWYRHVTEALLAHAYLEATLREGNSGWKVE